MIPFVSEDRGFFDDSPSHEFFQTGADIGAGDIEDVTDFLRIQRFFGKIKEGMHLSDRAVDAPLGAHLAPVENKCFFGFTQRSAHISEYTEIIENVKSDFPARFSVPIHGPCHCP